MNQLRLSILVGLCGLLPLTALGETPPAAHSLLQSSLSSGSEISSLFDRAGVPRLYTPRTSVICQSLESCLEATFYDSPDVIQSGPPGSEQLKDTNGRKNSRSYKLPDSGFRAVQLELQRELEDGFQNCPKGAGWKFADHIGLTGLRSTDCLTALFREKGLLDPAPAIQADIAATRADFDRYLSGDLSAREFTRNVLGRPKAFLTLPSLVDSARLWGREEVIQTLQETTEKALLLVLDALLPIADSANPVNPFFKFDRLIPSHSLLSVEKLYQKLWNADPKLNQWPKIVDLTPDLRSKLKGIYNDRSEKTKRWKVKGFYEEKKNQIAIDLSNDFYENAFVYFHELWHVAWSHSEPGNRQIDAILASLRDPSADPTQLRGVLLRALSLNEFQAIDQQIRLFHAVGELAQDWGRSDIPSTQAWEISHLSPDGEDLLKLKRGDRGDDWFYRTARTGPTFGFVQDFYEAIHRPSTRSKYKKKQNTIVATLDSDYWEQQLETHAKLFELVYFGETLDLAKTIEITAPAALLDSLADPEVPTLSCAEVRKVEGALDAHWQFGFPFVYRPIDPEGKDCPGGLPGPRPPGTEGSHGTEEPDPDLLLKPSSFPSLEGPEMVIHKNR